MVYFLKASNASFFGLSIVVCVFHMNICIYVVYEHMLITYEYVVMHHKFFIINSNESHQHRVK